jgi:hypothetical protein
VLGALQALASLVAGTLYTTGTYNGVALTGGHGAGATANIVVAGGGVTSVTLVNPGSGYQVGDVLSAAAANIGGTGSGFTITATVVATGLVNCRAILCQTAGSITYQQGPIGSPGPATTIAMLAEQILPIELNGGLISSLGAGVYELLA